ncbi:CvpA family protein [Faecalicatena contorta]|uniref:Colicin V production protein n=1 Tax=Faecalicatena contorta TaxID=39482 RepID=A0A315ZY28_9FIRM|nr:CvpA family protein [Faecalicatena contorta]PWJ50571.1 colicin V production protein [Faecalicatena contorta]SUQ13979.1 Colicin V production protein [Faecalicatena contorta]
MNNWLLIIVGVIFLIGIVVGYVRGFFKIGLSILSAVLTIVLMVILNPYVAQALIKYTPIDDMIEEKCIEAFIPKISEEDIAKIDLSGTPLEGLSAEQLADIGKLDWERLGITEKDVLKVLGEIPKDAQIKQIEDSGLPSFLKNIILENNNPAIYEELGVTSFTEYVAAYISRMVIKVVSFLVTFLLVIIIVNALMVAVDIIGELPGVGFLNHFAGGLAGIAGALLFVWIGFLVITMLYSTAAGKACFEMIDESRILTFLYNKNILLQKLLKF